MPKFFSLNQSYCERDSSGTTEREGAKVMERIARRERAEGARSGSPKFNVLIS